MSSRKTGEAKRWSEGMWKKPWICATCMSIDTTRVAPADSSRSATSLAVIGVRGTTFQSCRA
jgi:hypothetical protein